MNVGDPVTKPKGYAFPGRIVSVFDKHGEMRYVVESALSPGLLHIFSESQIAPATESEIDLVPVRREDFAEAIESALEYEGNAAVHRLADKYCPELRQAIYDNYAAVAKGGEPGEEDFFSDEDKLLAPLLGKEESGSGVRPPGRRGNE